MTSLEPKSKSSSPARDSSRKPFSRVAVSLALTGASLITCVISSPTTVSAADTDPVDLGVAATYSVLSGASVANTASAEGAPHTTVRGDLGVSSTGAITGFPNGVVTGGIHSNDAHAIAAVAALAAAYEDAASRTPTASFSGDVASLTLTAGVHHSAAAVSNSGLLRLDAQGNEDAVFILQVGAALSMAANAEVRLMNGAKASRVFWQVNGAADFGAGATVVGTIMAIGAISLGDGTFLNGRALSTTGAVALYVTSVYTHASVVTITGGQTASTTDSTPAISGTSTGDVGSTITVTIDGQTLTPTVQTGGGWSTTAALVANGVYAVAASTIDPAGNMGSTSQNLTVDTVPPVVTITGGATRSTNDTTPTITGTSDAIGLVVTVTVAGQSMTTLVEGDTSWNVTPSVLTIGTHLIVASVTDLAGNVGSASQSLDIAVSDPPPPLHLARFTPAFPVRIADTRVVGSYAPMRAGDVLRVKVTNVMGVPADATAAALNVTAVGPHGDGYLTLYPCTSIVPTTSTVNFMAGHDIANSTIATLASDGYVCVYASTDANVIIDVTGWFSQSGTARMSPTSPHRVADTRIGLGGAGRLSAGSVLTVATGQLQASAVALNVTAAGADAAGYLTVYPCGTLPNTSTVNFLAGEDRPNNTIVATGAGGTVCVFASVAVDVLVDVTAVFSDTGELDYLPATPIRLLDTRPGAVAAGGQIAFGVPSPGVTTAAVSVNVTADRHHANGYTTAFDCGTTPPTASTVNQRVGEANANGAIVRIGELSIGCLFTSSETSLIVDLNGWWVVAPA